MRPTSDRVRESIFDILASSVDLEGTEGGRPVRRHGRARHRGAVPWSRIGHVRRAGPRAAKSIKANLVHTGLDVADATIVRRDVLDFLSALPAREPAFDLVLCDPPYSFERWGELIGVLPRCLCVLESGSELDRYRPLDGPQDQAIRQYARHGGARRRKMWTES